MRKSTKRVTKSRTFGAVAARNRMADGKRVQTKLAIFTMRKDGSIWRRDKRSRGWSKLFSTCEMFVEAYRKGYAFSL